MARFAWARSRWAPMLFIAGSLVIVVAAVMGNERPPLMFIKAKTTYLEYEVLASAPAAIEFSLPVAIVAPNATEPNCAAGVFVPEPRSVLQYRLRRGMLVVSGSERGAINGEFIPRERTAAAISITPGTVLVYGAVKKSTNEASEAPCATDSELAGVRLPIWGRTRLGRIAPAATAGGAAVSEAGELLSGKVWVYGRSFVGREIYAAGEIDLPRGTRLDAGDGASTAAAWHGAATYEPSRDGLPTALAVSASVVAPRLVLWREGASNPHEYIEDGFSQRILGESVFMLIAFLIGAVALWGQLVDTIRKFVKPQDAKSNTRADTGPILP